MISNFGHRTLGGHRLRTATVVLSGMALAAITGLAILAGSAPSASAQPRGTERPNGAPSIASVWTATLPDTGNPIAGSSPNLANLAQGPAVVVGDRAGNLWAFDLANGQNPFGGATAMFHAPGPIDSTPSVLPGTSSSIFFGVGNAAQPYGGGYYEVNSAGQEIFSQAVNNQPSDPKPYSAVAAGIAIGDAPGIGPFAAAGSLGQSFYAFNPGGGVLGGFPFFQGDGDFSTPAIANLYYGGQPYIVDNGDSSPGVALGTTYTAGSILRVLNTSGQQLCQFTTNQSGESSPAVGEFLGTSPAVGIAFGTTDYFPGASDTDKVFAVDSHCNYLWSQTLDGTTGSSPALADVMGNGQLQVIEGTNVNNANSSGSVWVLNGADGTPIWHVPANGAVIGSIVTADLSNQGYQDLIVPTTAGVEILDGRSGQSLGTLDVFEAFQNSPLITTDPNGTIGITIAGYNNANQGVIDHFEVTGSTGSVRSGARANVDVLNQTGGWPMFHHDAQLTGDAGTPTPNLQVPCTAPVGALAGYYEAASDGGVFNFGNLPFCGSTGAISLNEPVVGIAATHDGGGYWMVAADGGIFAFGDAQFYGSMGGQPLNKPIVGMAATADGGGYYLVASDGGIFAFGDAHFYGSTGNLTLNEPIVGITLTPDAKGYWMVASDGGVFAFGDAQFFGSMGGQPLNKPIVGMAADSMTGGYWMVASDGGIFAFPQGAGGTPFYGSMGGQPLNKPIVGMQALANGTGYRFVAADGGIFSFPTGVAPFWGSMGGQPLNKPIVAMSGY
jgi:hypothetical protein